MKIGLRMGLSFGFILLFIIGLILIGLNAMRVINNEMETIVKVDNLRTQIAHRMIDNARETSIGLRNILIFKLINESDKSINKTRELMSESRASYQDKAIKFNELLSSNEIALINQFSKVKESRISAWQCQDQVIKLVLYGKVSEGAKLMVKTYSNVQQWITNVNNLIKMNEDITFQRFTNSQKLYANVRITMIILGIIAFVMALLISVILTLSIIKPMKVSVEAATRIASNDLSQIITHTDRKDEVGILSQAFRQMAENLRQSVKDINEGVSMLSSTASEILAATTQVASSTAETSTAISETTTTVGEVQQASKQSAQKAKNVADSSQRVALVSNEGQKAVEESIIGMSKIREQMESIAQTVVRLSEQSQSIGGIIASVTDIADQSNLLSVNAAIEAAKAGEQGKGFSVVAQEIKNLANRSKQATLQVRNILNDIQKATGAVVMATEQGNRAVEAGVIQSRQAGDAIRILSESSNEAVKATIQIVASSQQQVIGMEQIEIAMQNINQAGNETAVSMVQAEKSAKNLHELGLKLKDMVDRFKL